MQILLHFWTELVSQNMPNSEWSVKWRLPFLVGTLFLRKAWRRHGRSRHKTIVHLETTSLCRLNCKCFKYFLFLFITWLSVIIDFGAITMRIMGYYLVFVSALHCQLNYEKFRRKYSFLKDLHGVSNNHLCGV